MINRTDIIRNKKLFLFLFFIISFVMLIPQNLPDKPKTSSKYLYKKTIIEGNKKRTDYLDENNNITMAADLGYATVIVEQKQNGKIERYFDDKGEPKSIYPGYYAIFREYDEKGNNYHISFLGLDDLPVIGAEDYSDIVRTFYETGKIKTEKYYDPFGCPVNTRPYGYGFYNEYNEAGQNIKTIYLNEEDSPMVVGMGYAIVTREFYSIEGVAKGKVERELFFDENGNSKTLSMGYSGIHREYDENGQNSLLTYLDSDGKPVVTKKGYTTIVRTFNADKSIATERYFDIEGRPYSLSEGQFGIKYYDDKIVYLNQFGEEQFNLKRFLYNQSWTITLGAMMLVILVSLMNREWSIVLLLLYTCVILYLTIMFREKEETRHHVFLWQFQAFISNGNARIDILKNIWLFIPLGAILYKIYPKPVIILLTVFCSAIIEWVQYIAQIGFCEIDDIICNSIGGCIGFYAERLTSDQVQRIKSCKQIHTKKKVII